MNTIEYFLGSCLILIVGFVSGLMSYVYKELRISICARIVRMLVAICVIRPEGTSKNILFLSLFLVGDIAGSVKAFFKKNKYAKGDEP